MQSVLAISVYLLAHSAVQLVREKATGTRLYCALGASRTKLREAPSTRHGKHFPNNCESSVTLQE